jgi:hypothetical protein
MKNLFLIIVALVMLALTGCQSPKECIALCERANLWAKHCGYPELDVDTCARGLSGNHLESSKNAIKCWNSLIAWIPDTKAEFDCSKPPPIKP